MRKRREPRAVLEVDGVLFVIVSRDVDGFRAVRLRGEQKRFARKLLEDVDAEIEARVVASRGAG